MADIPPGDPPFDINEWGVTMDRWLDMGHVAHLLNPDASPACGVRYRSTSGPFEGIQHMAKCGNCERIWRKRHRENKVGGK